MNWIVYIRNVLFFQSKLDEMKGYEERLRALKSSGEGLDSRWPQETKTLVEQIQIFITQWEVLLQR